VIARIVALCAALGVAVAASAPIPGPATRAGHSFESLTGA